MGKKKLKSYPFPLRIFDEANYRKLESKAAAEDISINELINNILNIYLIEDRATTYLEKRFQIVLQDMMQPIITTNNELLKVLNEPGEVDGDI